MTAPPRWVLLVCLTGCMRDLPGAEESLPSELVSHPAGWDMEPGRHAVYAGRFRVTLERWEDGTSPLSGEALTRGRCVADQGGGWFHVVSSCLEGSNRLHLVARAPESVRPFWAVPAAELTHAETPQTWLLNWPSQDQAVGPAPSRLDGGSLVLSNEGLSITTEARAYGFRQGRWRRLESGQVGAYQWEQSSPVHGALKLVDADDPLIGEWRLWWWGPNGGWAYPWSGEGPAGTPWRFSWEAVERASSVGITFPRITPSVPFNDDEVSCEATATGPSLEPIDVRYTWSVEPGGSKLGTGPNLQLSSSGVLPGERLRCTAAAGVAGEAASEFAEAQIGNRVPVVDGVEITPSTNVFNTSTLTCDAVASDPDGTTPSLTYAWQNATQGRGLGVGRSWTLAISMASPGQVIRCTASASDGAETGQGSAEVTLGNRPPTITDVAIEPTAVFTNETVACSAVASDPDGSATSITYAWRNETRDLVLGSGASRMLHASSVGAGDVVSCTATASDGELTDRASASITVQGCESPPTAGCGEGTERLGVVRFVPAGTFTMGCQEGRDEAGVACVDQDFERPTRVVSLTEDVWVMESEVTQEMWSGLGLVNPSGLTGPARPVETVTWWETLEAANEASAQDNLPECYILTGCVGAVGAGRTCAGVEINAPSGHPKDCEGWRLPTEAEWEYAARAGSGTPFSGGVSVDDVAWHSGNNSPAGSKEVCSAPTPRNAWGLCDMSGNVWERVWDRGGSYVGSSAVDPVGAGAGALRVARGGCWACLPREVRAASRGFFDPAGRGNLVGFRLVRTVP